MSIDLPTFTEATESLSRFLAGQSYPSQVVWIFRDDVTTHRRRIWLRPLAVEQNRRDAESQFEQARHRGLGVSLQAFCQFPGLAACYVWSPKKELERQYALQPVALKLSIPKPLPPATALRSSVCWHLRRLINHHRPFGDSLVPDLPRRPTTGHDLDR
jgi:hypothetical protein